jgi:hypothetical protein
MPAELIVGRHIVGMGSSIPMKSAIIPALPTPPANLWDIQKAGWHVQINVPSIQLIAAFAVMGKPKDPIRMHWATKPAMGQTYGERLVSRLVRRMVNCLAPIHVLGIFRVA